MPHKIISILAIGVSLSTSVLAQSDLPVKLETDYSTFSYDASNSLVEIYLALVVNPSDFVKTETGYESALPLNISIMPASSEKPEPVWMDTTMLKFELPDTAGFGEGKYFVHQLRSTVAPGSYELRVLVPADPARQRKEFEMRRSLEVPSFAETEKTSLSDITLATNISPSQDKQDPFYKNGLNIRPSANQLYGQKLNQLFFYVESYNTEPIVGEDNKYTLRAFVTRSTGQEPVAGLDKTLKRTERSPDVVVGSFDLSTLGSGSYQVHLLLLDPTGKEVASRDRKFFVYNPGVGDVTRGGTEASFESSEYARMPESEIEQVSQYIQIIATDAERKRLREIKDLNEKRRFIRDFWSKRNESGSSINPFKEEFFRRVNYSNERYKESYSDGWKTDRGHTLIKYGIPTAIEPHLYESEYRPYEVWTYDYIPGEGNSMFVFADRNGFGQFELIFSDVKGERSFSDWENMLKK